MKPGAHENCAGFSILEGLAALALTGLILTGVSMLVAQWMPMWNRGFHRVQQADLVAVALDRMAADIVEARYVTGSAQDRYLFFSGAPDAITFVRPTLDPSARPGLEVTRITTVSGRSGARVTRRHARFTPQPPGVVAAQDLSFATSTALLEQNARVAFFYADAAGQWRAQWDNPIMLPASVRIELRDPATGGLLAPFTTVALRVDAPAKCASARSLGECYQFEPQESGQSNAEGQRQ